MPDQATGRKRFATIDEERWRIEAIIGRLEDVRRVAPRRDMARTFLDTVTPATIYMFWV